MLTALGVVRLSDLAGIQYLGTGGDSLACVRALCRVLAWPERPRSVRLLTSEQLHAFLLTFEREAPIAIKALADALMLLSASRADVEEIQVRREVLERLSASALTRADLSLIESAEPVRPMRLYDYVHAVYQGRRSEASVWGQFEPVMPYALIDPRLADLALDFFSAHDRVLLDGFRRLEDRIRERTGLVEHGTKLFSQAFAGDESRLTWHGQAKGRGSKPDLIDKGEQAGRAHIFVGTYQAFRNPRAHRTSVVDAAEALGEFLMLNQLFRFEAKAIERQTSLDCKPPQP
jgi:uncharacterized protein (TIGR02391 family)